MSATFPFRRFCGSIQMGYLYPMKGRLSREFFTFKLNRAIWVSIPLKCWQNGKAMCDFLDKFDRDRERGE
jgi:hypothetical protein